MLETALRAMASVTMEKQRWWEEETVETFVPSRRGAHLELVSLSLPLKYSLKRNQVACSDFAEGCNLGCQMVRALKLYSLFLAYFLLYRFSNPFLPPKPEELINHLDRHKQLTTRMLSTKRARASVNQYLENHPAPHCLDQNNELHDEQL